MNVMIDDGMMTMIIAQRFRPNQAYHARLIIDIINSIHHINVCFGRCGSQGERANIKKLKI